MISHVAYYSTVFIIALIMIGKLISAKNLLTCEMLEAKRYFVLFCLEFIGWSICTVIAGVSQSGTLDRIALLFSEYLRMSTLVTGSEIFASVTDTSLTKKRTFFTISSELLYLGVATLAVILFCDRADIGDGFWGKYLYKGLNAGLILYIIYYVCILFVYAAYTYMYSHSCTKKREYFIIKQCSIMVSVFVLCLSVESFFYAKWGEYVPIMYIGMLVSIFILRRMIIYKRSIEYNEGDYQKILAPSYNKPAFVCNDEGRVIFENTRAYVMQHTYKDVYSDKLLTDIFEFSEHDLEKLKDPKVVFAFEVHCKYPAHSMEMILRVKHNIDKYGCIFSTEVEVEPYGRKEYSKDEKTENSLTKDVANIKEINVNKEDIKGIRTEQLLKQLEYQKAFFEKRNESLFALNLKGITKSASVLGLPALVNLCDRIQTEISFGEWNALDSMIIDLDRQYESLKTFKKK